MVGETETQEGIEIEWISIILSLDGDYISRLQDQCIWIQFN